MQLFELGLGHQEANSSDRFINSAKQLAEASVAQEIPVNSRSKIPTNKV